MLSAAAVTSQVGQGLHCMDMRQLPISCRIAYIDADLTKPRFNTSLCPPFLGVATVNSFGTRAAACSLFCCTCVHSHLESMKVLHVVCALTVCATHDSVHAVARYTR